MKQYKCKFCGKETKPLGLSSHERLCPINPDSTKENHPSFGKKSSNQYLKGEKMKQETKDKLSIIKKGRKLTEEHKTRIKLSMREAVKNNPESYSASNVSGRVKIYDYNGFKLKGLWELEVAKWLDLNQIKWTNRIDPFEYSWENSKHLYFPDFYLIDLRIYIEVKGYETQRDREKWKCVKELKVIKKKEIDEIKKGLYRL
jgi:hypothetical protein